MNRVSIVSAHFGTAGICFFAFRMSAIAAHATWNDSGSGERVNAFSISGSVRA